MLGTGMLQEAARLALDGEIGNSDAIRLLQIPHSSIEVQEVLRQYGAIMTPSARSKLTVEMHAPLPHGVDNQRYEPLFDRHLISGRTHTTANGAVVVTEVQYYNGRMMQLYGEGTQVAEINAVLAGTGHRAVTLRHGDGREVATLQVWAQHLFDTSIKPYDSMFLVIPAVPETTPAADATFIAHANGFTSALTMLRGRYDAVQGCRHNLARLYFVRLYDSTQVAIDVGRERMGTDKRPGSIEVRREGAGLGLTLRDGQQRLMASGQLPFCVDQESVAARLAEAGATAGVDTRRLPTGTEHVFQALARIGSGPLSQWEWRTDVVPTFHPVPDGAVHLDGSSEEGDMLLRWGFTPKVMGYIPNVRGVITGLPEVDAPARHPTPSAGDPTRAGPHCYSRRAT